VRGAPAFAGVDKICAIFTKPRRAGLRKIGDVSGVRSTPTLIYTSL
jgi:hypothetical protein